MATGLRIRAPPGRPPWTPLPLKMKLLRTSTRTLFDRPKCRGSRRRSRAARSRCCCAKIRGLSTSLFKFAPGATLTDHEHVGIEQTFLLEGHLVDKEGAATGTEAKKGEFIWREPGSRHVAWSPNGGMTLAMMQVPNKFFRADGQPIEASGQPWVGNPTEGGTPKDKLPRVNIRIWSARLRWNGSRHGFLAAR